MELRDYIPVWDKLSAGEQALLSENAIKRSAAKGAILHNGSSDCIGLFILRSGRLRAYIMSDEGKEITIYRLFERDICLFSASCMMSSIQFDVMIEAETDCELWLIPVGPYRAVMTTSAPLANYTNEVMASRFSEVMWLIEQVMWKSVDKRLAMFLLEESGLESSTSLRITHDRIAKNMGTAREVVTRMLKYFQSEGMVALTRGEIELTDTKKLSALAE